MCRNSNGFTIHNTRTGESFEANCNQYKCPDCGPIKIWRLKKHLVKYFQSWHRIRFWTFTMTSKMSKNEKEHYRQLAKAWYYFTTYLRRTKSLNKSQCGFSYVKVIEMHKSGYIHFHVCVDQYLPYEVVQNIWENACRKVLDCDGHVAQAYVKGNLDAKTSGFYITKYISKALSDIEARIRRWSTSHGVKIYPEKNKNKEWVCLRVIGSFHESMEKIDTWTLPLLVLKERTFTGNSSAFSRLERDISLTLFSPGDNSAVSEEK